MVALVTIHFIPMIEKINDNLVLTIPLHQMDYDAVGQEIGKVPNLVGYSDGKQFSINYLIALGYKDDIQLGSEILMFDEKEELEEECYKLGLDIWEYERCVECDEPLLGVHTMNDKGLICCEHEK